MEKGREVTASDVALIVGQLFLIFGFVFLLLGSIVFPPFSVIRHLGHFAPSVRHNSADSKRNHEGKREIFTLPKRFYLRGWPNAVYR